MYQILVFSHFAPSALDSKTTTPFWVPKLQHPPNPKRYRFGHYLFILKKKKMKIEKRKKKKKEMKIGGGCGCGWSHPHGQSGGSPATPKGPKKKRKKKRKNGYALKWVLDFWGWPDHPQGLGGGFSHPLRPLWGSQSHPKPLGGGSATPKSPKPILTRTHFSFFFFWPFGGGRTIPLGMRVVRPSPDRAWGWLQPPPIFIFFFSSIFIFL
jgi:hypothetical protein